MERCGTHSAANIIRTAARGPAHVVHEEPPYLCREAKLLFETGDFRTSALRKKFAAYRRHHAAGKLVCEANHRLGFFPRVLMREFAPDCKFIFLVRDPIPTIISRIGIWDYYKDFWDKYPDEFKLSAFQNKARNDFNEYRLCPPERLRDGRLVELYLWEWLETYEFVRRELLALPKSCWKVVFCEDLTSQFRSILDFIGPDYFKVTDAVVGWSRLRGDSVYPQKKELPTDVFVTRDRNPDTDETVLFAKREVLPNAGLVGSTIAAAFKSLPVIDDDLARVEKRILRCFNVKML